MGEKPSSARITKTTTPETAAAKSSTGKAPMAPSGFQSYKDLDPTALFGEFHRRIGEHRQAEDSVIAELQDKFEVWMYFSPSPQVPGYPRAMTRDFY